MSKCLIIADRRIEYSIDQQSFGKVTVGRSYGIRGIREKEGVTLFCEELAGNGLYYPNVRIMMDASEAHFLAEQMDTLAKAIKFGYEPRNKDK